MSQRHTQPDRPPTSVSAKPRAILATTLVLGAAVLAGLPGCRGDRSDSPPRQFFPDMDDSPKFKPQTGTEFFVDGRAMRPSVPGTVPFGRSASAAGEDRGALLRGDIGVYFGKQTVKTADGKSVDEFLKLMPAAVIQGDSPVDREADLARLLKRGEERFNIYCSVCHNYDAKGGGQVGKQWSYPLPNLIDKTYIDRDDPQGKGRDGYLFHTIRNGVLNPDGTWKMPPYAHAVNERDAWAIVLHLRKLQTVYGGVGVDSLSDSERQEVLKNKPAQPTPPTPPTPPAGTGAAPGSAGKGGQS